MIRPGSQEGRRRRTYRSLHRAGAIVLRRSGSAHPLLRPARFDLHALRGTIRSLQQRSQCLQGGRRARQLEVQFRRASQDQSDDQGDGKRRYGPHLRALESAGSSTRSASTRSRSSSSGSSRAIRGSPTIAARANGYTMRSKLGRNAASLTSGRLREIRAYGCFASPTARNGCISSTCGPLTKRRSEGYGGSLERPDRDHE